MIELINDGDFYILEGHPNIKLFFFWGSSGNKEAEGYRFQYDHEDTTITSDIFMAYGISLAKVKLFEPAVLAINAKILFHRLAKFEREVRSCGGNLSEG